MLILIDLGNTSATAGIFKGLKIVSSNRFVYDNFPKNIYKWIKSGGCKLNSAIYCSVNPKYSSKLTHVLSQILPKKSISELKNSRIPVKNRYNIPGQAGIDRLINVYGGGKLYGNPCLVIDIGTAITFDLGGPGNTFEGGLIFSGPNLAFDSLQQRTAKIGNFPLDFPKKRTLVGRSTRECVVEGVAYGYGHLIRGVIGEFRAYARKRWGRKLNVVVTGGYVNVIKPFLSKADHTDKFLTLKAMARLYGERKKL